MKMAIGTWPLSAAYSKLDLHPKKNYDHYSEMDTVI